MKILGLVLARAGSKGLPGKNTKSLNGKPLISYILEEARTSEYITDLYVSTDDWKTKYIAENMHVKVINRPEEFCQDNSRSIDAVEHAIKTINEDWDYVVLLNACCPLTSVEDIDAAIEIALETEADSVVSLVEDFSSFPSKTCGLVGNKISEIGVATKEDLYFIPFKTGERQMQFKVYKRNAALYIFNLETMANGTFFGKDKRGYVMPKERSLDINDQFDFDIAEFLIKKQTDE